MLMHHAHARGQRRARMAGRQRLTEDLDRALVGHIMAEEDVHQRGLARAVLTQKRHDLSPAEGEADAGIGQKRPEPLGDPGEAQDDRLAHEDFGSLSSMPTVKEPSLIAASRSATSFMASSGTLPSKVPSGASDEPPSFMKE